MKTQKKTKKHQPTSEELRNDPSLRWVQYRRGEAVYSDQHQAELRFYEYVGDRIRLATLNGIAPLEGTVGKLEVRRLTAYSPTAG